MAKSSSVYVCQNCGFEQARWAGQCSSCQQWNTLVEEVKEKVSSGKNSVKSGTSGQYIFTFPEVEALKSPKKRFSTEIDELNRVLGGDADGFGMVPGAVMLIGGEPGIGKSTLLTQMVVALLQKKNNEAKVMYVSGEESPTQIAMRVNRLLGEGSKTKKTLSSSEKFLFVTSTQVEEVTAAIRKEKPTVVIVDSIQTLTSQELTGVAGSVGQVRECADQLTTVAKQHSVPIFMVGHVTKEGEFAGPKVLEHIVDSVLEFTGERTGDLRLLRAIKNRFGATDEVGMFRVTEYGFESVSNPSALFLEHREAPVPGSATICVVEGTRPLLVEVQTLVNKSFLAMPRRVGRGVELSRIQVLTAVLQKHCSLPFDSSDAFVSIAGGFTVREPALDLGMAVALASSLKNKPVPNQHVFIGEIGLLGEIRTVNYLERRIKEAQRLGFKNIVSRQTHSSVKQVLNELRLL